jgi:predicted nucleotide-binding protein
MSASWSSVETGHRPLSIGAGRFAVSSIMAPPALVFLFRTSQLVRDKPDYHAENRCVLTDHCRSRGMARTATSDEQTMDKDTVVGRLNAAGLTIRSEQRMGNETGWQIRLDSGAIVNCYDNGNVNFQGRNQDAARAAIGLDTGIAAAAVGQPAPVGTSRKIFVVYGHDPGARAQLDAMLRRWELEPLILDQLPSSGQTIIEKLDSVRRQANFAVVLVTPDDEGHAKGKPEEKAFRARQNVVLELGMMLAHLGRSRVAILMKSDVSMERPSDIQGLLYIPFKDDVEEAKVTLVKEMAEQGIHVDMKRL